MKEHSLRYTNYVLDEAIVVLMHPLCLNINYSILLCILKLITFCNMPVYIK